MSLEKALADLQAALEDNTAALLGKKSAGRDRDADGETETPRRRSRGEDAEEEETTTRRTRGAAKDDDDKGGRGRGRPAKDEDEALTIDKVRGAVAKFLGDKDSDGYDKNADFIEKLLTEVKADTVKEIAEEDWPAFLHWVGLKKAGKKVDLDDRGPAPKKSSRRVV